MADHITDPRVIGGAIVISSGDDHVTLSGRDSIDSDVWTLEFGVRDNKIYVVQDTGTHLSAYLVLATAGLLP